MSSNKRWLYLVMVVAMALALVVPLVATGASQLNGISSPKDGATVSGVAEVTGFASDPNFLKWQLDVLPGGNSNNAIFLATGTQPGAFAYTLDSTPFPNGEHALRLRVVRTDSNYDEYVNKFTLANGAPVAAKPASTTPDIVDTAVASGQFATLVAAVQAAGLVDALKGEGPYTVFAPTQEAFAAIPADTLSALLKDPKALSNILLYHVVPGKVMAADVTDGLTAKTLQGSNVSFKVSDGKVMINDANIVSADIVTSNGVIHVIDKVLLPPAPAASTTAPAATANGITSPKDGATVSGIAEVTGFAQDPNFLKWQLDVLPGGDGNNAIFLATGTQPGAFAYTLDSTPFPNGEHALRLRVVRTDSNYDEYVNKFTLANGAPVAAKPASTTPDIVDTAVASGQFATLVAAVQAAGLVDALKGEGPYTVFAPTQEAFAAIPADTLSALLKDPKALSNILLYHVVPGKVMAADVTDGLTAKTLQGSNVIFKVSDDKVMINDANIVSADIVTSNGVIHVIDKVLLPPAPAASTTAPAATANGITSPKDGATVSGIAEVTGFAQDPNFLRWQLDVLPGGDGNNPIFLATGTQPGAFAYTLDSTPFPNGEHALRLRVVRTDSNYDEYVNKFTLKN